MAKTNPIGVRFDKDLLEALKEDKLAESPQKALNYLTEFYRENRAKIDFKKMFEDSPIFKNQRQTTDKESATLDKAYSKGFTEKTSKWDTDPDRMTLEKIKLNCPSDLTWIEKKIWIAEERKKYGI